MNRLIALGFLVMAGVIIFLLLRNQDLSSRLDKVAGYEELYNQKIKENEIWKDQSNHWRNKAEVAVIPASVLKEELKKGNPELLKLKSEFKNLKKNLSNLQSTTEIQTSNFESITGKLKDTLRAIINGNDTIQLQEKVMICENEWSLYRVTVDQKLETATVEREGKEDFDIVMYWNRVNKKGNKTIWPLGKIEYKSEIMSQNPETKIVNQKSLIVKKKR